MTVYTSRFGVQWNYAPHDTGWGTAFNFLHREVAALLHPVVISDTVTTPPGSPAENDTYFVPSVGATGAWSTHANKIAAYQGGAWQYYTPEIGTRLRVVSRSGFYWWNGTALTAELTSGGGTFVQTVAGHAPDIAGDVALVVADVTGAAPLSSPTLTGTPLAPTAAALTNNTQIATTNYVDRAITALGGIASVAAGTGIGVAYASGVYTISVTGSYAPLASPTFTGTPAAPTASAGTNTTQIATTAFVQAGIAALVNSAPALLDTLGEIATELTSAESTATALATTVAAKAPLASPTFTGTVTIPAGASISGFAPLASPTFTGTPAAPTPLTADNSTKLATTAYVQAQGYGTGTGSGSVTSVAMTVPAWLSVSGSPITTSGTLAVTASSQAANVILAGPSSGGSATPAFRALVAADIPIQPYVVSGFYPGVPANAQLLLVHQLAMAVTFPANFGTSSSGAASKGGCTINATASTVISIDKCLAANDPTSGGNWTQIGTLTISAGGHAAALATASGTLKTGAAGDFIRAVGPSTADATAANIFITLAADR